MLHSEENVFNLGMDFTPLEKEFFTVKKYTQDKTWVKADKLVEFRLLLDSDTYEHKRSIYTFWDMFGDIGGLKEIAFIFASIIIGMKAFIFGSGLDQFLLTKLFFVGKKA